MSQEQELAQIRDRIDAIDHQLMDLITERAVCARKIAKIKIAAGDWQFYRPEREAQILRRIKAENPGPLGDEEMTRLFREIMSACLALEQPLTVAYLGPAGTFTQTAALKHFGRSVKTVPLGTIPEIFREVEAGSVHYGVVPVENSTEGVVSHTLDSFVASPLFICGEVCVRIHHFLLSRETTLSAVNAVYSHQQSLAQCRGWLDRNLPQAERIPVASNAEAARLVAERPGTAAIASEAAAEIYALDILAKRIEDEPDNTTRFLIIGRADAPMSGDDKTSLLLACRNEAGGLHAMLTPLVDHDISMTRIESRPSRRGVWDYVFFVDIMGHRENPAVLAALEHLKRETLFVKVLGSYPEAVL
ncbi:chorismate mutase, clade 2 [Thioflavicoccus mobilis 8321]|uniref:Bifunctional chorismate mutase/prephenate dehydratase n=1 Tax=Thioflavicoccus mobilis 8321 TaxID=765912 RepID=L0GXS4_9GAMM|nr:prephenate dehydratase [Thioflavicoccus mobilis]AGA90099.1 chorismate mutase, clade 2 [Thioflavicoccus mobilis 8321]